VPKAFRNGSDAGEKNAIIDATHKVLLLMKPFNIVAEINCVIHQRVTVTTHQTN
jgi:hypothetical protein